MCVEINHLLACGHHNDELEEPYQIRKCLYMDLSEYEQRMWERVNGKHEIYIDGENSYVWYLNAICDECSEGEDRRLRRGEPLKWPRATETV